MYYCVYYYPLISFIELNVVVNPDTILVTNGNNASFECLTFLSVLNNSLEVTWEYPFGANVVIEGTKLTVVNANSGSEGDYVCKVNLGLQKNMTAVGTLIIGKYLIISKYCTFSNRTEVSITAIIIANVNVLLILHAK